MIPFRSTSYNRISGERDTDFLGNSAKLLNDRHDQGHAILATHFLRFAFRIPWDEWTIGPGRRLRSAKSANEIIDLPLEFVSFDKAINAHRPKNVADSLPHTTCRTV